jgi:hypothetical protein
MVEKFEPSNPNFSDKPKEYVLLTGIHSTSDCLPHKEIPQHSIFDPVAYPPSPEPPTPPSSETELDKEFMQRLNSGEFGTGPSKFAVSLAYYYEKEEKKKKKQCVNRRP